MNLGKYVRIIGDRTLLTEVRHVVMRLAQTPEGMRSLKQAEHIHHRPLIIYAGGQSTMYHPRYHAVIFNPFLSAKVNFRTVGGGIKKGDSLSALAHEIAHAGQPGLLRASIEYNKEERWLKEKVLKPYCKAMEEELADWAKGQNIASIEEIPKILRPFVEQAYDRHLVANAETILEEGVRALEHSPGIQGFTRKYEAEAIRAENIAARRQGKPPRLPNYIRSSVPDKSKMFQAEKPAFVDATVNRSVKASEDLRFWRALVNDGGKRTSSSFARGGQSLRD